MNRSLRMILALAFGLALALTAPAAKAAVFTNSGLTATKVLLVNNSGGGAIQFSYYNVGNPNAAIVYIQFFDAATTAAVTLGTTAPTFWVAVPALGGVVDTSFVQGFVFKLGVVVAATTTPTGSTAATSTCPLVLLTK